ncbi:MAG: PAS domain S-box protein [Deltaproteobacteria bacterium]|nr:PAS domain S-box protein [Deltaproteobacteria bacterium]
MERVVNPRIRVLIAEDLEDDALLIIEELRRGGYDAGYRRVETEEGLSEALAGSAWSLVITDYSMPRLSAMEVIKVACEKAPDLPVIIVSGVMGEDFAVDAMKAGAKDYLIKDRLSRLAPAVERVLREAEGIRARRRSEEEARHLNRLLRTVTEIDQAIVRQSDMDGLLSDACRILVEQGGFLMCWIGMADFENGRVVPAAQAGFEDGCLEGLAVRLDGSPRAQGPTGTAIRTGSHVVCRNTEADERFRPWREEAGKRGYRSTASFPLRMRGRVVGAVNVYSEKPGAFEEKTVNLLDRLADDIGYALQVLEESQRHALAVAALRESEERLRTIFESAMDGMFVIDMEGRYVDVNFAGCHMFGYTREEILSSDVSMLIFPEDIEKKLFAEHRGYWKKGAFIPEVRMRKKDGAEIWVDLAITPFSVGDKDLALGIKRDITERRLAEEALRESEERFRQIFEQNEDAQIILKHGTCEIIDANPAATTLYGFTREELVEGGTHLLMRADERENHERKFLETVEGRGVDIDRMENVRKDGAGITVSIKGQIIRLKSTDVVYCTVRDMTEKLRLEEEARFIQAKLIHANKMASIGTLAAGVAHEINNPNNFILFNSTLLSDAWKDAVRILELYYRESGDFSLGGLPFSEMREVIPELLSGITDGSRRIKGIVDNLKDFSRVSKTGMEGEMDVNRAVMAAASILSNQINNYTDDFTVECAEGLPPLKGNEQKIEQVIINLIINALHALPSRDRGVRVSTAYDSESGCVLLGGAACRRMS